MGRLSTHVLDTVAGRPAAGMEITLDRLGSDGTRTLVKRVVTNADGRTDEPLLTGEALIAATYELTFQVDAYFSRTGAARGEPAFLTEVPIRFTIGDSAAHYHVPLLVTPWSYQTYRGS